MSASGVLTALGGVFFASRLGSAGGDIGVGMEITALTAVCWAASASAAVAVRSTKAVRRNPHRPDHHQRPDRSWLCRRLSIACSSRRSLLVAGGHRFPLDQKQASDRQQRLCDAGLPRVPTADLDGSRQRHGVGAERQAQDVYVIGMGRSRERKTSSSTGTTISMAGRAMATSCASSRRTTRDGDLCPYRRCAARNGLRPG